MIEDKELSDIFKIECDEHIQNIDNGFLRLEKNPEDMKNLEDLLREIHSIKGASRMVAVLDIEAIAHNMEDVLDRAIRSESGITSEIIDRLYHALDAMRQFVHEAITGESSGIESMDVISHMRGVEKEGNDSDTSGVPGIKDDVEEETSTERVHKSGTRESGPEKGKTDSLEKSERVNRKEEKTTLEPSKDVPVAKHRKSKIEEQKSEPERLHIDAIRVETKKLDALLSYAGELVVSKTHITRRLTDIDEIVELWEQWNKSSGSHRFTVSGVGQHHNDRAVKILANFIKYERKYLEKMEALLKQLRKKTNEDNTRLDYVVNELEEKIGKIRLLPFSIILNLFPRMVRDIAKSKSKKVQLVTVGGETTADKKILEAMKDPLTHIIRNAIDHGIEAPDKRKESGKAEIGTISLRIFQTAVHIVIEVKDDGAGIDIEAVKQTALKKNIVSKEVLNSMSPTAIQSLIFTPGFSTDSIITDVSGRGIGLGVVHANVEMLKGTTNVESSPGIGTIISIHLPVTLSTSRVLILRECEKLYAMPVEFVQTNRIVSQNDIFPIERRKTIVHEGQPVSVAYLSELLGIKKAEAKKQKNEAQACIFLTTGSDMFGIIVDELLDELVVVLKPHSTILKRVRNISGATILGTGEVCMVLNPNDLQKSIQKESLPISVLPERSGEKERKKVILLAEDSITTRTQEKRILEGASYEVVIAVNGVEAWNKLNTRPFDAVVSDIQMPSMDGWALTEKIRKDKKYKDLPIILVTTLTSDEDKKRGIELGADAYISKPAFDQKTFLDILERLI